WSGGLAWEIFRRNLEYAFVERDFDVVHGTARTFQTASMHVMEKCGFLRQSDRTLRDWPVCYYKCSREAFLAQHVIYLMKRLGDVDQDPSAQLLSGTPPPTEEAGADKVSLGR
ncbi:MAG: GNAT family N-acetyltransferase, partial [Alphaproteobacteria bacterium]|nr:GNAT family N-acetyltransferase [Alphaproteobacteria bacterium]